MKPRILERGIELLVGMGDSFGDKPFDEISKLWMDFQKRMKEIEHVKNGYALGVCMHAHDRIQLKPGDNFIYIAALPVFQVEQPPEGMVSYTIPESKYAVFTHCGPLSDLTHTKNYIWGTWVPKNKELLKRAPEFELYDARFDPKTASGEFDIYLPIAY